MLSWNDAAVEQGRLSFLIDLAHNPGA